MNLRHAKVSVGLSLAIGTLAVASVPSGAAVAPRAARYQFGINTYVTDGCTPTSTYLGYAHTTLSQYKALGANAVALAFPLYTDSLTSNDVYAKADCATFKYLTPPVSVLSSIVQMAHSMHLAVLLRPLIDESNLSQQNTAYWRGELAPSNVNQWFTNYLATLRPFLQMAQTDHVEHFAIETELDSLAGLPNWKTAISLSKAVYNKGDLSFDYSWDTPAVKDWWGITPAVDAYPKLVDGSNTQTVSQLVQGWNHLLKSRTQYALPNISKVVIEEIGIESQDGAYTQPEYGSLPASTHPFNQTIQVRWFSAACDFMKQHGMKGIYYWGPWMGQDKGSLTKAPDTAHPNNIQPQAQASIKACFK